MGFPKEHKKQARRGEHRHDSRNEVGSRKRCEGKSESLHKDEARRMADTYRKSKKKRLSSEDLRNQEVEMKASEVCVKMEQEIENRWEPEVE